MGRQAGGGRVYGYISGLVRPPVPQPFLSAHRASHHPQPLQTRWRQGRPWGWVLDGSAAPSSVTITKQQPSLETQFSHNGIFHSLNKYGLSAYCVLEI